jgi:hypothetical protein
MLSNVVDKLNNRYVIAMMVALFLMAILRKFL